MAHIALPEGLPGISGPMNAYPETGIHLRALANALLRGSSPLTPGERELIAASVSAGNQCVFCTRSHAAVAQQHLQAEPEALSAALAGDECELVSPRLRALLAIAELVRRDGRAVIPEAVAAARAAGADDRAIHDTVLIAAAFCMYNRYVDGLATSAPQDAAAYAQMGAHLASNGY